MATSGETPDAGAGTLEPSEPNEWGGIAPFGESELTRFQHTIVFHPENPYVAGPTPPQTKDYATFETKAYSRRYGDKTGTGGGYERWRSWEVAARRSQISGGIVIPDRKMDVYAPLHRLSAVVWCYPDDMPVSDILAHLDGRDVHHTTGEKWAVFGDSPNFPEPGLQVTDHGRHSEVTQAQMRAFAADSRERAEQVVAGEPGGSDGCAGCESEDVFGTTASLEGEYCHSCLLERVDGETIEVL